MKKLILSALIALTTFTVMGQNTTTISGNKSIMTKLNGNQYRSECWECSGEINTKAYTYIDSSGNKKYAYAKSIEKRFRESVTYEWVYNKKAKKWYTSEALFVGRITNEESARYFINGKEIFPLEIIKTEGFGFGYRNIKPCE